MSRNEFQFAVNCGAEVREAVRKWIWRDQLHLTHLFDLETMQGACALASYTLWQLLKRFNIDSTFIMGVEACGMSHCWIELDDRVIDVTATQFKDIEDDVYTSRLTGRSYYKSVVGQRARSIHENEFALDDLRKHWGGQSPFRFEDVINQFIDEFIATHFVSTPARRDMMYAT